MRKRILLLFTLLFCFLLAGCQTSIWYNIKLDNGEVIKVALNTNGGYKLTQKAGQFKVKKGKKTILNGAFIPGEKKNELVSAVYENSDATVIKDNSDEFVWTVNEEYNRIVNLPGAEVYALVASLQGEKVANKAYEKLAFMVVKGNGKEKVETDDTEDIDIPTEPESPEIDVTEDTGDETSPKNSPETTGQSQAVDYAQETAYNLHLSRKGLLDTMSVDSASMPDATPEDYEYAVKYLEDNGFIDWNLQALDRAFEYLKTKPDYSKEELKQQLIDGDNFTDSEAQYAVDNSIIQ